MSGDALIGRSRSRACTQFLWCDDSPFMIFIDSDIVFTPEDIEKTYRSMQAGYEVVGGMYAVADGTFVPAQAYKQLVFDGSVQEMRYVSTGFLGISRNVLRDIKNKLEMPLLHKGDWCECYPFFESGSFPETKIYISEDWDFCNKVRTAGHKVYLHTGVQVGHIKTRIVTAQEAINNMVQASQPNYATVTTECLIQTTLFDDLVEFLGITNQQLNEILGGNPVSKLAEEWKTNKKQFYETNQNQIYDLMLFNITTNYWNDRLAPLIKERGKTILDIGCGIGTASLYLAQNRNTVDGYDLNGQLINFADFRRRKFGMTNLYFGVGSIPNDCGKYDLVVAIDVLEHIENLREFLLDLGGKLKPETRLYHCDVFEDHPEHHPMHFDHSKSIDGWLRESGFIPLDNRWAVKK